VPSFFRQPGRVFFAGPGGTAVYRRKGRALKTVIVLCMLVLLSSIASAELYRWEDANGINFSDDFASLPERYHEHSSAGTVASPETVDQQVNDGLSRQNKRAASLEQQAADHRANLEQHRQALETFKQKQISAREFDTTLKSLARYIVVGVILGLCLFVVWIVSIVDIVRSGFITTTIKFVWLLLVIFLPLLGMLFYMILGSNQKSIPPGGRPSQSLA
jgi:hypothetical protein